MCEKGERFVDHVPMELLQPVYHFLKHGGCVTCEVTGKRKRGHGLEFPCVYRFGAKYSILLRNWSLCCSLGMFLSLVPFEQRSYMVRTDFYCTYYIWLYIFE